MLLGLAGVVTATPLLLFAAGARRVPLTVMGMLQFVAPILQFIIGVWLLGEPMSLERWIGFGAGLGRAHVLTIDSLVVARGRSQRRLGRRRAHLTAARAAGLSAPSAGDRLRVASVIFASASAPPSLAASTTQWRRWSSSRPERDGLEGARQRADLREDVDAVLLVLDHLVDAAGLTLDAPAGG